MSTSISPGAVPVSQNDRSVDATNSSPRSGPPRFDAHQGREGLLSILAPWQALARSLGGGCSFQHRPEWYLAFLESGASDPSGIWFITAYRENTLIAVFPLQYQNYRIGPFTPRLLGTLDDDQLQLSDFVFAKVPENAALLQDLVDWLRRQRVLRWDGLRLRKVREDSAIRFAGSQYLPRGAQVLQHDASTYFDTSGSLDQATRAMTGDFKRNVRRQARRAEELHPLSVDSANNGEHLAQAFAQFLQVEASGWKGAVGMGSAIQCQAPLLAFYQKLTQHFGEHSECTINVLKFGDEAVAGQFGIRIGRTLHLLKFGYNEVHARFAPGNVLLLRILEQACLDPDTDIVNLVNDPLWSRRFRPLSMGVWSYFVPNTNLRGMATLLGLLAKRAMDRWHDRKKDAANADAAPAATPNASNE